MNLRVRYSVSCAFGQRWDSEPGVTAQTMVVISEAMATKITIVRNHLVLFIPSETSRGATVGTPGWCILRGGVGAAVGR